MGKRVNTETLLLDTEVEIKRFKSMNHVKNLTR